MNNESSVYRLPRQRSALASLGSNPGKRRSTPIPVLPPRIPTPMPATNNNNLQNRIVTGGNNKTKEHGNFKRRETETQELMSYANATRICPKFLDNEITTWINPRLISKIDLGAVTSNDYNTPAISRSSANMNGYNNKQTYKNASTREREASRTVNGSIRALVGTPHANSGQTVVESVSRHVERAHSTATIVNNSSMKTCSTMSHPTHNGNNLHPDYYSKPPHNKPHKQCQNNAAPKKHVTSLHSQNCQADPYQKQFASNAPKNTNYNVKNEIFNSVKIVSQPTPTSKNCVTTSGSFKSAAILPGVFGNSRSSVSRPRENLGYSRSPYQVSAISNHSNEVDTNGLSVLSAGSASGVFAMYSESKYSFTVNGLPNNSSQASAAAAFFARASQKLNLSASPHRRKRHSSGDEDAPGTGFCGVIQRSPPPVPPALLRRIGVREITGVGKVKVMLRVCSSPGNGSTNHSSSNAFFNLDKRKKQVTLYDPTTCSGSSAPEDRRVGVAAPKMFAFDAIFSQDDSQTEVCSSALTDVIHAVINGTDGCLFCFGHAGLGKSYTMLGSAENANTLGIIPCAIAWLFRGINEQKQKTGARFSVRVSAVEVCGPSNQLKDLLAGHANESEQSPGVYLRDDPVFGTQLQNHSELRVPTAEKAAFYLDAAIDSRGPKEHQRDSHLLYTLHVYQYSVAGKGGVAGGRSRLHLIDLGNSDRGKSSGGIPLSGLGNILLAIFNGQKHLPYKEHKLTHVLKECLSSLTCHAAMVAHVSPYAQNYVETLTTVQLASRIHRMRRRKIKFIPVGTGNGSGGSSGEEATRTTGTSSEPDPSSSDLSADTVIYVGPADDATDGEHPPVYIPSLNSGDNRCAMGNALRGSSAEQRFKCPTTPKNTQDGKSPSHRITTAVKEQNNQPNFVNKSPAHINSAKSSPVRTKIAKAPVPSDSKLPGFPVNTSDEQWIDGPRISKHKVAEARHLMKETHHVKKRETWIDGPMQGGTSATATAVPGNTTPGYGYMDSHKKSMIRKWVENQTCQIQKTKHTPVKTDPKLTPTHSFKEMTTFKTCEEDEPLKEVNPLVQDGYKKQEVEKSVIRTGLKLSSEKNCDSITECKSNDEITTPDGLEKRDDFDGEDDEEIVVEIPPALPLIQPLSSREVSMESLDVRLKERLRSTNNSEVDEQERNYCNDRDLENYDDEDEILEIIEVEEPLEPVPMQDSCLQCTEEDIEFCMNSLHTIEEEKNPQEHPLRILSQENLTVVSTFTDSMSVFTDLERTFPRANYETSTYIFPDNQAYTIFSDDYEDPDCPAPDLLKNVNPDDTSRRKFEQLARLHEIYTNRLAKANVTNSATYKENTREQQRSLSRFESLSISDMLYGNAHETGSIYSEPPYRPDQEKFCENCKVSMSRPATANDWYADPQLSASATHLVATENQMNIGGRFQRFCHKSTRDNCNIASLRHPDGASNPNLKDVGERIPGNGASGSDQDEEMNFKKNTRKAEAPTKLFEKTDGIIQPLPIPINIPSQERLDRKMLSISSGLTAIKLNEQQNEGYDSGHDSTPRTSKHSPAAISRRAESGYDSVVRDSESSSIDSDVSRRSHAQQTRGGVLGQHEEKRIRLLRHEQTLLRIELAAAKARLMIPCSQWNFELHVENSMDILHPGYLEALEAETIILRKRVDACKSHIMIVTCFDSNPKHIQH